MPTWEKLCSPIAEQVSRAWIDGLPDEAKAQAGPLLAMMGSMGGMAFGSQLGQGLAQLSGEVLTSTDVGLPLGPDGTAALLPRVDRRVRLRVWTCRRTRCGCTWRSARQRTTGCTPGPRGCGTG